MRAIYTCMWTLKQIIKSISLLVHQGEMFPIQASVWQAKLSHTPNSFPIVSVLLYAGVACVCDRWWELSCVGRHEQHTYTIFQVIQTITSGWDTRDWHSCPSPPLCTYGRGLQVWLQINTPLQHAALFFFLCGCFGNGLVKGAREEKSSEAFNALMWKQPRKPRTGLRKNRTSVLQFVHLSLKKEALLSGLLHFTFRSYVLGCLSIRGALIWRKAKLKYIMSYRQYLSLISHLYPDGPRGISLNKKARRNHSSHFPHTAQMKYGFIPNA